MTKTDNFNLNKPEGTDPMRVEDFNQNADLIDAALAAAGNCKIMVGNWIGDGEASRAIQLPIAPKLLFVFFDYNSSGEENWPTLVIATDGTTRFFRGLSTLAYCGDPEVIKLNSSVVTITRAIWCNRNGQVVTYVALY